MLQNRRKRSSNASFPDWNVAVTELTLWEAIVLGGVFAIVSILVVMHWISTKPPAIELRGPFRETSIQSPAAAESFMVRSGNGLTVGISKSQDRLTPAAY